MRADFRKSNVTMADGTTYSEVRFAFSRGIVAVWSVDMLGWSAHRVYRATGATFKKRKSARVPHEVLLADGTTMIVQPLYNGGACCSPHPLKEYGTDQLVSESFTATPAAERPSEGFEWAT